MDKVLKFVVVLSVLCFSMISQTDAMAAGTVVSRVRVIHASSGPFQVDPRLRDLEPELRSVFRYTSYRLLNEQAMNLGQNQTGRVSIPGGRVLELTPAGVVNGRIKYRISILKNRSRVFGTEILLLNGSSLTIGGPAFQNGFLLFNISGLLE